MRAKEWHCWQGYNTYPGFVHFPYVGTDDNLAYLSCAGGGFKILDISNPAWPQVVGECKMTPPFATKFGGALCHTFMPIHGTNYAVGMQEGERQWTYTEKQFETSGVHAYCGIEMFDVSNPADPVLISIFPYPEVPGGFPYKNFNQLGQEFPTSFGPHILHEPMTHKPWIEDRSDRVYDCYFHAGLRVYDVSDPYVQKKSLISFRPIRKNSAPM